MIYQFIDAHFNSFDSTSDIMFISTGVLVSEMSEKVGNAPHSLANYAKQTD